MKTTLRELRCVIREVLREDFTKRAQEHRLVYKQVIAVLSDVNLLQKHGIFSGKRCIGISLAALSIPEKYHRIDFYFTPEGGSPTDDSGIFGYQHADSDEDTPQPERKYRFFLEIAIPQESLIVDKIAAWASTLRNDSHASEQLSVSLFHELAHFDNIEVMPQSVLKKGFRKFGRDANVPRLENLPRIMNFIGSAMPKIKGKSPQEVKKILGTFKDFINNFSQEEYTFSNITHNIDKNKPDSYFGEHSKSALKKLAEFYQAAIRGEFS